MNTPLAKPELARQDCGQNPVTGAQIRIGVMGSAAEINDSELIAQCHRLGRAIAGQGCSVLTGACPGMPHEVVLGAKAPGGHSMGISPAVHLKEHIGIFASPYKEYDVMIYTGLGLMGRELINIRSSDIIVVVGGRCGTLGEFAIAYEEGKPIGVLTGTGGITDVLPQIVDSLGKKTGSEVIYDRPVSAHRTAFAAVPIGRLRMHVQTQVLLLRACEQTGRSGRTKNAEFFRRNASPKLTPIE